MTVQTAAVEAMWDRLEHIMLDSPMLMDRPTFGGVVKIPYPPPVQPATVMPIETWPGPVEKLAAHAALFGWVFDVRRAEGYLPHASYGTPSVRSKVSWAMRLARPHERAVAVQMDGKWSSLWFWSETQLMTRIKLLDDFYAVLGRPQAVDEIVDNPVSFPVTHR